MMETIESFAARLNGRDYRKEISKSEEAEAKHLGFLVAYGASDDLLCFSGVVDDEVGAWDGAVTKINRTPSGLAPDMHPEEIDTKRMLANGWRPPEVAVSVTAEWSPADLPGTSWRITADKPFAPFNVMEDGEVYCVGAVIALTRAGG